MQRESGFRSEQQECFDEILQRYSDQAILTADPKCLTTSQLERRDILLGRHSSKSGLNCQAVTRREPTQRRPRKGGREETARLAAYLPPYSQIDFTMTNATVRVYGTLWRLADEGHSDPSVLDIARQALCDVRTAQRAISELVKSGHLAVTYRRVRRGMNDTSVYRLTHYRGRASTPSSRGGKNRVGRGDNVFTLKKRKDLVVTTSMAREECSWTRSGLARRAESDLKIASFEGSARKLRTIPGGGATQSQPYAGFGAEAGRLAVASLEAQGVGEGLDPHDCEAICAAVDRLRRQRFPGFAAGFWEKSVVRLGFRAYLAVIEVAELAAVKQIHDMTAYLGGILRKPSDEVRPDMTLARLQYSAAA